MDVKLMFEPNYKTQIYNFSKLELPVEKFGPIKQDQIKKI